MREVDQALARAFAQRNGGEASAVPPPPHLNARPAADAPTSTKARAPSPNLAFGPEPVSLVWSPVVQTLERDYGERFAAMADALADARARQNVRVLLFTSCHRAEGRTTLVLTVARALARKAGRTLLVDADTSGPMLARQLGLRPAFGLDDVVEHGRPLADALIEIPDDNLAVLPLRAPASDPSAFGAGPAWSRTLSALRREFDHVLLDGGPLFSGLSADVRQRGVDAAVLVRSRAMTGERALRRAREALDAAGVPLLGVAETFVA